MHFDTKPCEVCGSEVELQASTASDLAEPTGPAGPPEGYVGDADSTPDRRVCTNPACPNSDFER